MGKQQSRKNHFSILLIAAILLGLFSTGYGIDKASNFTLKDQGDRSVTVKFPSDKVVILIFGDRKGSGQIDGWSKPIYERYSGRTYLYGIASLSGVPRAARPLVRRLIRRQTSFPVLLDWGGSVSKSYTYDPGKATIVIVGKDGKVLGRRSGPATSAGLNEIYKVINAGL